MSKFKNVLVVCPGNAKSGGPEALHHLVHELRMISVNAYIVYLPFDDFFEIPEPYSHFNVEIGRYTDEEGSLIVFPEIYPLMALKVQHARAAIWWLSIDNFLERRHVNKLRDKIRYFKGVMKGRRPLKGILALRDLLHFSQSCYSTNYLESNGISCIDLFEPINERFLRGDLDTGVANRIDEILYNPSKGKKITERLIQKFPHFKFTALKGFNREQLTKKFQTAKVYIDFGHHPGRDRLPREAAVHGCCIVTNRLGSAGNDGDIPIESTYKLEMFDPDFETNFGVLIQSVFNDYPQHYSHFSHYRLRILSEPQNFRKQIENYFL